MRADEKQFLDLIRDAQFHRTLVGVKLRERRKALGVRAGKFAELCGWSKGQQSRLEHGVNEVHIDVTNKIIEVLTSLGEKNG